MPIASSLVLFFLSQFRCSVAIPHFVALVEPGCLEPTWLLSFKPLGLRFPRNQNPVGRVRLNPDTYKGQSQYILRGQAHVVLPVRRLQIQSPIIQIKVVLEFIQNSTLLLVTLYGGSSQKLDQSLQFKLNLSSWILPNPSPVSIRITTSRVTQIKLHNCHCYPMHGMCPTCTYRPALRSVTSCPAHGKGGRKAKIFVCCAQERLAKNHTKKKHLSRLCAP